MLAVDGQQTPAALAYGIHEQTACGDEAFLVGKRDVHALVRGSKSRFETRRADNCSHRAVGLHARRLDQPGTARSGANAGAGKCLFQIDIGLFAGRYRQLCPRLNGLAGQKRHIGIARQRYDLECFAPSQLLDDIERIDPDRPGRAKDGNAPALLRHQVAAIGWGDFATSSGVQGLLFCMRAVSSFGAAKLFRSVAFANGRQSAAAAIRQLKRPVTTTTISPLPPGVDHEARTCIRRLCRCSLDHRRSLGRGGVVH